MEINNRTNPSQEEQPRNVPQQGQQNESTPQEGDIRKVIREDEKEAFDDQYEVEQEDAMGEEESDTEDENNTSSNKRGDTFNRDAR
jgi:hypothetical protein